MDEVIHLIFSRQSIQHSTFKLLLQHQLNLLFLQNSIPISVILIEYFIDNFAYKSLDLDLTIRLQYFIDGQIFLFNVLGLSGVVLELVGLLGLGDIESWFIFELFAFFEGLEILCGVFYDVSGLISEYFPGELFE